MIDFHCHLDLYADPRAMVEMCSREKLEVLSVTTTPSAWEGTRALAKTSKFVRTALGLHPELAHERFNELALFDQLLGKTEYVGEIGLDRTPGSERTWDAQQMVLKHVLKSCSAAGGRIMSLHSRRAARQVLDHLEDFPRAGTAILHWPSCTQSELSRAISIGCWFSVGPAMLNSKKGRDLVVKMPRERVLTESDGPFALVRGRRASPNDVALALPVLAEIWGESLREVEERIRMNLQALEANT